MWIAWYLVSRVASRSYLLIWVISLRKTFMFRRAVLIAILRVTRSIVCAFISVSWGAFAPGWARTNLILVS